MIDLILISEVGTHSRQQRLYVDLFDSEKQLGLVV